MPTPLDLLRDPATLAVLSLYLALFVYEALFPARALPEAPGERTRGLVSFVVFFFVSAYLPLVLAGPMERLRIVPPSSLGVVSGAVLALLVYEALAYTWHRLLHGSDVLFRAVHQMHHSAERLDVASAFLFSPLDMIGFTLVTTLTLALVGLRPESTMLFLLVSNFLAMFQHANIRTPYWLGYLVQRPENHSHHHARGVHAGNYANLSFFDIAFGTFENHREHAEQTGYYSGASARVLDMLALRDVSVEAEREESSRLSAPNRLRY